jgi:hypothetical protein
LLRASVGSTEAANGMGRRQSCADSVNSIQFGHLLLGFVIVQVKIDLHYRTMPLLPYRLLKFKNFRRQLSRFVVGAVRGIEMQLDRGQLVPQFRAYVRSFRARCP